MTFRLFTLICTALTLVAPAAWAAPKMSVTITQEQEVVVEENGKQVTKRVEVVEATPGEELIYTLEYRNDGDEAAKDVVLNDPIPANTQFVAGSAFGPGAEILYSVDGGASYNKPALLSYKVTRSDGTQEQRQATPVDYTNIQWIVESVEPGKSGIVGFRVRVK
ncbi:MAG: hypothetical protein COX57_11000 [Alphaproteobacteria bacterium CG_4_10_14_0_2_um_filter_63_37]|nr:MAG: hypothetical protein AUJ55_09325 [Proteobacteria bacterium CG1_02_64_396]PJA23974.1 MAG: hypothetical protein COX57_11000 [Alphaproteobacteria bacterium CG_4_10_14_0_2_um_filter_63_37]